MPYGDPDPAIYGYVWSDAIGWYRPACCCCNHSLFPAPLLRQDRIVDSRDVAAEWGDGPLDADEDTKRVSRQEVGGANPPRGRTVAQQESASQIPASTFSDDDQ